MRMKHLSLLLALLLLGNTISAQEAVPQPQQAVQPAAPVVAEEAAVTDDSDEEDNGDWCHSDFVLVPFFYTYRLFENMKSNID